VYYWAAAAPVPAAASDVVAARWFVFFGYMYRRTIKEN